MSLLLEGKRAFITGGTRGIGKALCDVFAREGADVAFSYGSRDDLAEVTRKKIEEFGRRALAYKVSITDRAWDEVINTNVGSLFAVTKPIYKQMIRQRFGKILNITSIGAMRALPTSVHYATSKAAMIGFTKCLAREAGTFGVSVNAIAAGIFDTELAKALPERLLQMHDFWASAGRLGRPEELAEFAAFMVSDRNSFMNGEVVIVDGGAIT